MSNWPNLGNLAFTEGDWSFSVATTPEDKLACYRVRYNGLTLKLGDERYANHKDGTYIDPWDDEDSLLLLARHRNGTVAGTLRYQWRQLRPFPADELYDFQHYATLVGCCGSEVGRRVALLDRLSVLLKFQRIGVFPSMELLAERISHLNGVQLHTALIAHKNAPMARILESRSWRKTGRDVIYHSWTGIELYKLLEQYTKDH